mmetsp:Transcript_62264/g.135233  ORF Transcript_62264/g.135233 Transcript_62264/m.135233 type:complete len:184 (+) Transcript_62264:519-1070(+)
MQRWGPMIEALNRLIELRPKQLDPKLFGLLGSAAIDEVASGGEAAATGTDDVTGGAVFSLPDAAAEVLHSACNANPHLTELWRIAAELHDARGFSQKSLDCRIRQLRAAQFSGWERDAAAFKTVVDTLAELCPSYVKEGSARSMFAGKSSVNSALAKAKTVFEDSEDYNRLRQLLQPFVAGSE